MAEKEALLNTLHDADGQCRVLRTELDRVSVENGQLHHVMQGLEATVNRLNYAVTAVTGERDQAYGQLQTLHLNCDGLAQRNEELRTTVYNQQAQAVTVTAECDRAVRIERANKLSAETASANGRHLVVQLQAELDASTTAHTGLEDTLRTRDGEYEAKCCELEESQAEVKGLKLLLNLAQQLGGKSLASTAIAEGGAIVQCTAITASTAIAAASTAIVVEGSPKVEGQEGSATRERQNSTSTIATITTVSSGASTPSVRAAYAPIPSPIASETGEESADDGKADIATSAPTPVKGAAAGSYAIASEPGEKTAYGEGNANIATPAPTPLKGAAAASDVDADMPDDRSDVTYAASRYVQSRSDTASPAPQHTPSSHATYNGNGGNRWGRAAMMSTADLRDVREDREGGWIEPYNYDREKYCIPFLNTRQCEYEEQYERRRHYDHRPGGCNRFHARVEDHDYVRQLVRQQQQQYYPRSNNYR